MAGERQMRMHSLKAGITGINLATDAPEIFRSLAEATCFGAKAIVERFKEQGIPVKGLIGIGGVAKKSEFIMQMMADILNLPIKVNKSEQSCGPGCCHVCCDGWPAFTQK